jgi:hypothetical protein
VLFSLVMCDDQEGERKRPLISDGQHHDDIPNVGESEGDGPANPVKRPRGPSDCLDWDESEEEEFTPFTQERPKVVFEEPKKVFARKSKPKGKGKGKKTGKNCASSYSGKFCIFTFLQHT